MMISDWRSEVITLLNSQLHGRRQWGEEGEEEEEDKENEDVEVHKTESDGWNNCDLREEKKGLNKKDQRRRRGWTTAGESRKIKDEWKK